MIICTARILNFIVGALKIRKIKHFAEAKCLNTQILKYILKEKQNASFRIKTRTGKS